MTRVVGRDGRYGPAALVTGASDGLGRAMALALAEGGFDLILVARRDEALEAVAREARSQGAGGCETVAADLGTGKGVDAALSAAAGRDVGLLISAAGFGSAGAFLDQRPEEEAAMVDLNCRATVALCHAFGRRLADRGRGGIVLFGSLVGFQGAPWSATYAATKGFVQGFGEALRVELAPRGVDVLVAAPGPVATGFAARAGMAPGAAARPEALARPILAALGRRTTVRPGLLAKALGHSIATLPRPARVAVMGRIMAGMSRGR